MKSIFAILSFSCMLGIKSLAQSPLFQYNFSGLTNYLRGNCIINTIDSGVVVLGDGDDANSTKQFQDSMFGFGIPYISLHKDGYAIGGSINSPVTGSDFFFMTLDTAGNTILRTYFSCPGYQHVTAMKAFPNLEDFALFGYMTDSTNETDYLLGYVSALGPNHMVRFLLPGVDYGLCLDNGYDLLLAGFTIDPLSSTNDENGFVIKYDGHIEWSKFFDSGKTQIHSVGVLTNQNWILAGSSRYQNDVRPILFIGS